MNDRWTAIDHAIYRSGIYIGSTSRIGGSGLENAAFIARACNAYEAAQEAITKRPESGSVGGPVPTQADWNAAQDDAGVRRAAR